jgi:GNAT superfamily N-acetyltransferase
MRQEGSLIQYQRNQALIVRPGTADDIPALSGLCRESFPASPRWVLHGARTWWMKALACRGSELWVAESACGLQGFVLFLRDEHAWASTMAPTSWERMARTFALLFHPTVLVSRTQARLRPKSDLPADAADGGLPERERLFVELIAVSSRARGSGIGRALVAFGCQRAAELRLRGTCYRVDRRNAPMIALMRSSGCRITGRDRTGYLFSHCIE